MATTPIFDMTGAMRGIGRARGAVLHGAFARADGVAIRFVAGRPAANRMDAAGSDPMLGDEVDVRKWPAPARLALMVLGSLLLWLGIAALFGLI